MFECLCFFTIRRSLFGYFYLLFVCRWIYRISYLYYALFAVIISLVTGIIVTFISNFFTGESSKRSCLSWSGKKLRYATGIFFSCRYEHAWWLWQEVCTQVGGSCLLLFTTWVPKGQQTPKICKFAFCTMTEKQIDCKLTLNVLESSSII